MSEGNLLEHHHHHQQRSVKLFCSSRDSELELVTSGHTPTPPKSATHSPEIRSRSQSVGSDARREALLFFEQHRLFQNSPDLDFVKGGLEFDCELRSISSCSSPHPNAEVQIKLKGAGLRQQSDSNLLDCEGKSDLQRDGSGRARSQSQGQCGSLRRRHQEDECSVIVINTTKGKSKCESRAGKQKASKWLEEIQFTAQYQHYRTNNYASVVSSASSLDKSDGGGGAAVSGSGAGASPKNKNASEAEQASSSKPASSSSNNSSWSAGSHREKRNAKSELKKEDNLEDKENTRLLGEPKDDLNRQNSITTEKCWNFPRVKLRKLFTAKSLDDILGGGNSTGQSSGSRGVGAGGSGSGGSGRKSLQVAGIITAEESSGGTSGISGERSSSSPEFVYKNPKKAQLFRDNKLSLPRIHQQEDGTQLLIVKPYDGTKSPGAHSSKSAIVISTTGSNPKKSKKAPTFIKATRQKSRSFSALTSAILSKVPGGSSSVSSTGCNSPCSSTTSNTSGLSFFTKRSQTQQSQDGKGNPPVPIKRKSDTKSQVPCAKSDNCLNRIVASANCSKLVDIFSSQEGKSQGSTASSTTLVEQFAPGREAVSDQQNFPGTPSSSSGGVHSSSGQLQAISSSQVVTAQPRKWTAIKNKWDQKLQASGDRQKEIGASLASVSNNAQIFRKAHHHHHQSRQRSNSLSPLDNPEDKKSIESLLEITSPSPTLQEVRFLDTPEIRYASPVAVRNSYYKPEYNIFRNNDDDEDEDDDSEDITEKVNTTSSPAPVQLASSLKGSSSSIISKIVGGSENKDSISPVSSRASSRCSCTSKCETESCCSGCKEEDKERLLEVEAPDEEGEMTRHTTSGGVVVGGGAGTKRSRDHHHHHHHRKHHGTKEKPKLVVANVSYLQRPQSPGLVLRESSPCSSTASNVDNTVVGHVVADNGQVIKNSNVFSSDSSNNNSSAKSKAQQAKLEFFKSFSPSSTPATCLKRDPLSAKNQASPLVNVNERKGAGAGGYSASSFGASSNFSVTGGANNTPRLGRNTVDPVTIVTPHQPRHGTPQGRGAAATMRFENTERRRNLSSGAELGAGSGSVNQNQYSGDFSQDRHYGRQAQGANLGFVHASGSSSGETQTRSGERSTDNQSSDRDPRGSDDSNQARLTREDPSLIQGQGPLALAQQSSLNNNNLFIDVDFEGSEEDTMGDLQSPQYVKRTAHMFDSRFSTPENGANGHGNGRNPSYLNVSRSVSGYSCLSYNNGSMTSETVNKSVLGNGASLLSANRVTTSGPRLKDFSLHSPFSRTDKVPNTDDDSSDHSSNQSATSPPPSLPPINTTSTRFTDSSPYFQNGMSRVGGADDLLEDTPYVPSHGKSFIMQRIERLYGSDAVQNKQVLGRKLSNPSHVTTISISRDSPRKEHIIPIKVEPRDDHQNNLYNKKLEKGEEHVIPISFESAKNTTTAPKEDNFRRIPIETRHSISIAPDSDEDGEDKDNSMKMRRARSKSPTKNLNGNANCYRNGVSPSSQNGKPKRNIVSPIKAEDANPTIEYANGNKNNIGIQDCTVMKKSLSRESSAESEESNNSLELASIGSEVSGKDSQESVYSTGSSVKPKPKPKPKDMALLRTLSRSPASLKTGQELDKTVTISIKPDLERKISCEDQVDRVESTGTLADIKNTIAPPKEEKLDIQSNDKTSHIVDKENKSEDRVPEAPVPSPTPVKDGNYFKNEMNKVTVEILKRSEKAAKELEELEESDDRAGCIHAAVGKGNLLVKKKFKQFEGLCDANLKGATADEPETTNEDLAGFWDMVMIQVEQVYSLFDDLEKKQESEPKTPTKSASPKRAPNTSKPTPKVGATPKVNSAAAKARDEARRKLLAEKRRQMKNQLQQDPETVAEPSQEAEVQIFAPDTSQSTG